MTPQQEERGVNQRSATKTLKDRADRIAYLLSIAPSGPKAWTEEREKALIAYKRAARGKATP